MVINGSNLVVYIDGEPVAACDEVKLTLPEIEADIIITCEEQTYTFQSSKFQELEMTFEQEWNYNWWKSKVLPRKQKKAYRKKLIKMLML